MVVKLANPANPLSNESIKREWNLLRSFDHPNIVHALDFGTHKFEFINGERRKCHFIVLEDCGPDIHSLVLSGEQLIKWSQVKTIIANVASALECLRYSRINHRDLNPTNICFKDGRARLIDFGLAKNDKNSIDLSIYYSAYSAPELKTNFASDLFSLGAIAWFLTCEGSHLEMAFSERRKPPIFKAIVKEKDKHGLLRLFSLCLTADNVGRQKSFKKIIDICYSL